MMKKLSVMAAAVATLVACGGGGSGGASSGGASVTLGGTAALGLLAGAKVSVYAIGASGPAPTPLQTGLTQADGSYALSIAATDKPLLVVVESGPDTQMLDETTLENGEFKRIAAPLGATKWRSIVSGASSGVVNVNVNPFTEFAVAAAEAAKDANGQSMAWSADAIAAGRQLALKLVPDNVDPFTTRATRLADVAGNDQAENDLLVALSGHLKKAYACANDDPGVLTAADLQCEQDKLKALALVTVGAQVVSWSKSAELAQYSQQLYDDARQAAAAPLASQAEELRLRRGTDGSESTIDAGLDNSAQLASKASLVAFVEALRQGFQATETTLRQAGDTLDARYANVSTQGAQAVVNAISWVTSGCSNDSGTLQCDSSWQLVNGVYQRVLPSDAVAGATLLLQVSGGTLQGSDTLHYVATQQKNGKTLSATDLQLSMAGLDATNNLASGASGTLNVGGSFTAYDTASSKSATLDFQNLVVTLTNASLRVLGITGTLALSTSLGDRLVGTLVLQARDKPASSGGTVAELSSFKASLRAEVAPSTLTQYATLDLSASISPKAYSGLAYGTYSLDARSDLTNLTQLGLTLGKASATRVNGTATIASKGSAVVLSVQADAVVGRYCLPADDGARLCSDDLKISTKDGSYTALLSGGATSGDILDQSGAKVGTISRSGVKVNGVEYSFF